MENLSQINEMKSKSCLKYHKNCEKDEKLTLIVISFTIPRLLFSAILYVSRCRQYIQVPASNTNLHYKNIKRQLSLHVSFALSSVLYVAYLL